MVWRAEQRKVVDREIGTAAVVGSSVSRHPVDKGVGSPRGIAIAVDRELCPLAESRPVVESSPVVVSRVAVGIEAAVRMLAFDTQIAVGCRLGLLTQAEWMGIPALGGRG